MEQALVLCGLTKQVELQVEEVQLGVLQREVLVTEVGLKGSRLKGVLAVELLRAVQ
jgi:hypothetical protein